MLRISDPTVIGREVSTIFTERVPVEVSIQGLPECKIMAIKLNYANWSTTSDITAIIFDRTSVASLRTAIQIDDPANLPKIVVSIDGQVKFRHYINFVAKNIAFGKATYSMRGISSEILLRKIGTLDFNLPPYDNQWNLKEMITTVLYHSGSGITPICLFGDRDVLHITDYYEVSYRAMLEDLIREFPMQVTFSDDDMGAKMYFVDTLHKARASHVLLGNDIDSMTASITYIPPEQREW